MYRCFSGTNRFSQSKKRFKNVMLDVWIANLMPLSLHILLSQGRQEYILRARQIKVVQKTLKETLTWNNGAVAGCPIKLREIEWLLNYTPKKCWNVISLILCNQYPSVGGCVGNDAAINILIWNILDTNDIHIFINWYLLNISWNIRGVGQKPW